MLAAAISKIHTEFIRYTGPNNEAVVLIDGGFGLSGLLTDIIIPDDDHALLFLEPTLIDGTRDIRMTQGDNRWVWMGYPPTAYLPDAQAADIMSLQSHVKPKGNNNGYELRLPHLLIWATAAGLISPGDFIIVRYNWWEEPI